MRVGRKGGRSPNPDPHGRIVHLLLVIAAACLGGCAWDRSVVLTKVIATTPATSVRKVDFNEAPEMKELAERARQIGNEMYPKALAVLSKDTSEFPRDFDIVFKKHLKQSEAGWTQGKKIKLNADWLAKNPDKLGPILIHEMAHLPQGVHWYRGFKSVWTCWMEGLPDYVRYKLGDTSGWRCPQCSFEHPHYTYGYNCAGAFRLFVDATYGSNVVRQLNTEPRRPTYSDKFFAKVTGKSLEELWVQFQRTPAFMPVAAEVDKLYNALGYVNGKPPRNVQTRFKAYLKQQGEESHVVLTRGHARLETDFKQEGETNNVGLLMFQINAERAKDFLGLYAAYQYVQESAKAAEFVLNLEDSGRLPGFSKGELRAMSCDLADAWQSDCQSYFLSPHSRLQRTATPPSTITLSFENPKAPRGSCDERGGQVRTDESLRSTPYRERAFMKRRKKKTAFILLGVLATAWLIALLCPREPEPAYQGKPISVWFREYVKQEGINAKTAAEEKLEAVKSLGDAAVPFLISRLNQRDSRVDKAYQFLWGKLPVWVQKRLPRPKPAADIRRGALDCLSALGPSAVTALPALREAFRDEDVNVRAYAAFAVPQLGSNALLTIPALTALLKDKEEFVRMAAAESLGKFGPASQSAIPELIGLLKSREDNTRVMTMTALRQIGGEDGAVIPALVASLRAPSAYVRDWATWTLPQIAVTNRAAVTAALTAEAEDRTNQFRARAGVTLWRITGQTNAAVRSAQLISSALARDAHASSGDAVLLLSTDGPKLGLKPIVAAPILPTTLQDPDGSIRAVSAKLLAEIGTASSDTVQLLVRALDDGYFDVCISAANALKTIGKEPELVVPALIQKFRKWRDLPDGNIPAAAAEAIGSFGPRAKIAVPALIEALKEPLSSDPNRRIHRSAVIRAIGSIGPDAAQALPVLVKALQDPDFSARLFAVQSIGRIGVASRPMAPALIELLSDPHWWVRREAARALALIGGDLQRAVPALKQLMMQAEPQDNNPAWTRTCAAAALWRADPQDVLALEQIQQSIELPEIGGWTVRLLGDLGTAPVGAVPALKELLQSDDPNLRKAALSALRKIDPDAAEENRAVTIEYIAHACFRVTSPSGKQLLIDPYASRVWLGYDFPPSVRADAVLISHPHYDHDGGEAMGRPVPWAVNTPVLRQPGTNQIGDIAVVGYAGKHADPWGEGIRPKQYHLVGQGRWPAYRASR